MEPELEPEAVKPGAHPSAEPRLELGKKTTGYQATQDVGWRGELPDPPRKFLRSGGDPRWGVRNSGSSPLRPLILCVTLSITLPLSGPQSPHL